MHVLGAYRGSRCGYCHIYLGREQGDGLFGRAGKYGALLALQAVVVYGCAAQRVGTLLVEEACRGTAHQRSCLEHVKTSGSSRDYIDVGVVLLGGLHHCAVEEVVGKGSDREGDDGGASGEGGQCQLAHGGR